MKTLDLYWKEYIQSVDQLLENEEYQHAEKVLLNILAEEPGYGKAHGMLGRIYLDELDEQELAEFHLKLAIRFDREFEDSYFDLVQHYEEEERFEEILILLKPAIEIKGLDKSRLFLKQAQAFENLRKYKEALLCYKKAYTATTNNWATSDLNAHIKRVKKKRKFSWVR